jgi:polysaccharide deacetylase family protein (PEP-CTERM system associated)
MKTFLFSVDLEDVRLWMEDGERFPARVVPNTERYLAWLHKHKSAITFFTVGQVAEREPDLIKLILDAGHEIALHSYNHMPLEKLGPAGFADDLGRNLEALYRAGATSVIGYRAPIFSLTEHTAWAYALLEKAGIRYSSSVLPAKNPLYGWPGFGDEPKKMDGVWELPMTTASLGFGRVPIAGGTYLRLLPTWLARAFCSRREVVLGYAHPYDVDVEQERFMHPGLRDNPWMNRLMYVGRRTFLPKVDVLLAEGARMVPYGLYVQELDEQLG